MQRHYDALVGKPCAAPSGGELCVLCDQHDKIFGVVLPGDFVHPAGDPTVFRQSPDTGSPLPRRTTFAVAAPDDTLVAQVLTCPGCRRQLGWAVVASLRGLRDASPALRADLQASLGWQRAPLLGDVAAFKAAPAGDVSPTALACPDKVRR